MIDIIQKFWINKSSFFNCHDAENYQLSHNGGGDNVFFLVKFELKQGKNRRSDKKVVIQKGLKFVRLNFIYVVAADVNKFFLNFLSLTVGGWEQFWSRKEVYINI